MAQEVLYPNGIDSDNANFSVAGAPTKWEALDDPRNSPNDSDYVSCGTSGQEIRFTLTNTSSNISAGAVINFVRVFIRCGAAGGTLSGQESRGFIRSGGVNQYGTWVNSAGLQDQENQFPTDGSAPFTKSTLDSLVVGIGFQDLVATVDANRHTQLHVLVDFVASPVKILAARRRASARLLLRGSALQPYRGRF